MKTQSQLARVAAISHRVARGFLAVLLTAAIACPSAIADGTITRIKDITTVEGDRINQLSGMGLVVGLAGTGGKTPTTRLFALNMLQRYGQRFDPALRAALRNDAKDRTDNMSAVMVLAELPADGTTGQQIDVTVSAVDDAKSLLGGVLVFTPLMAVNGEVYAVAQGTLSTGGFSFEGNAASVQKNHPTTARIPNGATIEAETCSTVGRNGKIRLLLRHPDYETARRIAVAVNKVYPDVALQLNANAVQLTVPVDFQLDMPGFLGLVGDIEVMPDNRAIVVINERTGTVVIGGEVKLSRVLITHGNLSITTAETPEASQPLPFSEGETLELPRTQIDVFEESGAPVTMIDEQASVADLAQALNALGVAPRDLSSIFQALKEQGSLQAELQIK